MRKRLLVLLALAFAIIGLRASDDFLPTSVTVETGGALLIAGSLVAFAGLAVALTGISMRPAPTEPPRDQRKGVTALVLGIAGFIVPVAGSLGIAFGQLGMADARAHRSPRGLALAGFIVGLVALALWSIGVVIGMFAAEPSAGN